MSYTPTNWKSGDIVTAARLNNLEQGIGGINVGYTPHTWTDGDTLTAARMNAIEQAVSTTADFSIATLTINLSSGDYFSGEFVFIDSNTNMLHSCDMLDASDRVAGDYQIPIYKSGTIIYVWSSTNAIPTISGNITRNQNVNGQYIVTGNAAITVDGSTSDIIF